MPTPKIYAIIPAAGSGVRMGADSPKQYLELAGMPVLEYALYGLGRSAAVAEVVLCVCDAAEFQTRVTLRQTHPKLQEVINGGASRADSVYAGILRWFEAGCGADDWILVHDGARPCLPLADLQLLIDAARAHGSGAVLAVAVHDTLKIGAANGCISATVPLPEAAQKPRWRALTPQMFRAGALREAYADALARGESPRDESEAMEARGVYAKAVAGSAVNIKITVPEDLAVAARALATAEELADYRVMNRSINRLID